MKQLFAVTLALLSCLNIFAHTLWIETNANGQKGKLHDVKIFYGEYSEGSPEKVADWYSDVKAFKLWLVTADNRRVELPVTANENHFSATFTPASEGSYYLLVSHEPKDLGRTTKYQFNASAVVRVGKNTQENLSSNFNPLKFSLEGNKLDKPVIIRGFFNDNSSDKMSVTVFSPGGWTKEIKGNEKGIAEFIPEWTGKYMIEVSRTDDEKGDHAGSPYERVWRCATYLFEVK